MLEVEYILQNNEIPYRLIELTNCAMNTQDVARFSQGDFKLEEICKTVIMKDDKGNRYAFFLIGTYHVNNIKAKKLTGKKLSVASPTDVREVTGVDPGAVCPLLIRIPLTVDKKVLRLERVNFGSGHHLYGIEMKTKDFLRVIKPNVDDIAEP
jgi:prolyl-tRNA editing enzyme YbaK/EbsC (Cys-tRNA(Pro) deacylase)